MKNFMFFIILLCLLITGIVFTLDRTDHIDRTNCKTCDICPAGPCAGVCTAAGQPPISTAQQADHAIGAVAQAITADTPPTQVKQTVADPNAKLPKPIPAVFRYKPPCQYVAIVLKISNFILVLAAVMFCLTLLLSLKISLAGRLGGISHISRAFFYSLFTLLILLPWQVVLPGVLVGAVYTPCELLCRWHTDVQNSVFWLVICYLRFAGLWLVVLWMFFLAWMHSRKWARATLQRRGLTR